MKVLLLLVTAAALSAAGAQFNEWVQRTQDMAGARPGSAIRYVPESHSFFLWGFMNDDPDLLQDIPGIT